MVLALLPTLRRQHLPLKFDWVTLSVAYWLLLAAQSIFLAGILSLIGMPDLRRTLIRRYRENPFRIIALGVYFAVLVWAASGMKAVVLTVDTIALLELYDRGKAKGMRIAAEKVVPAAAYLFFGFLMVLAYNCAIVSARYNFTNDPALAAIDRWLLHGHAVWEFTHWALGVLPLSFFKAMEFVYFGMFPQIGAAILMVAMLDGRARALQFVGTILLSYYLALVVFYIWPAQGPYYLCPNHFSRFPAALQSYTIQKTLIPHALALWRHEPIARISTDYFVGFPAMHMVQPMIVLWFLRRWRRIVLVLAAYDLVLVAAIFLLEMHYVVDLVAGAGVTAAAIAISGGPFRRTAPPVDASRAERG